MADERYRSDNYGRADAGQRSSRSRSQDMRPQRTGGYSAQDRYPSGRPKTQPYDSANSHRERPEYSQGADSGSRQGSYSQTPSYIQRGRYGQQGGYGQTGYGRPDSYSQEGDGRYGQDENVTQGRYNRGDDPRDRPNRADYGQRPQRCAPQSANYREERGEGMHSAAREGIALPEPVADLLDRLQANPLLLAAIAGGVGLVVVIVLIASCVAGNAQQGYVQAEGSQGANAAGSSEGGTGSVDEPTYTGTAAGADGTTGTDGSTDGAAATEGTDAAQATTDSHDQTPHDVDDVTTIAKEDVWSYATTSFNKDAAYNSGGVEDPWSPTGYFTTGDSELDQMVKDYCDGQTQSGLDAGDNAYYTYLHISWLEYVEDDQNQRPWDVEGDWRITYAKQCFTKMTANCYEFAAAVQYIMRYYGYADAIAETCLVLKQSGAWGDHGLVFLTSLDGRQCLIDTSLSSNGWLLPATSMTYSLDNGYRAS